MSSPTPNEKDGAVALAGVTKQLDFFRTLAASTGQNYTNTFAFYSQLPVFLFNAGKADTTKAYRREFEIGDQKYSLVMKPANIERRDSMKAAFPGQREEIIREVVTKMATEDPDILREIDNGKNARNDVELVCSMSKIRRRLEQTGHGWKLAEIHEALQILSECRVEVKKENVRISPEFGLLGYAYAITDHDSTGEKSVVRIRFHPLLISALKNNEFRHIQFGKLLALRHPLARWLYQRISHHFTGATKGSYGWASDRPYNITLDFILKNTTMKRYPNLRDNAREVREALSDLKDCGILSGLRGKEKCGYDEDLRFDSSATGRGRKPLVDVLWNLWLTGEVVDDIIAANVTQKTLRGRGPRP